MLASFLRPVMLNIHHLVFQGFEGSPSKACVGSLQVL